MAHTHSDDAPAASRQWHRDRWHNALVDDQAETPDGGGLRARALAVALVCYKYCRKQTTVQFSMRRLALETGFVRNTAVKGLQDLKDAGWLTEVEKASGTRPATFELSWPKHLADSLAAHPVSQYEEPSGSPSEPVATELVAHSDELVAHFETSSGSPSEPNKENKYYKSPPTPSDIARELLGWDADDERLQSVTPWLETMGARDPRAYLTTCHRSGRLPALLTDFHTRQPSAPPSLPTWQDPNRDQISASPEFIAAMRAKRQAATR